MGEDSMNLVYLGSDSQSEAKLRAATRGEDLVCFGAKEGVLTGESIIGAFLSYQISHSPNNFLVNSEILGDGNPGLFQLVLRAKSMRIVSGEFKPGEQPTVDSLLAEFREVERSGIKRYRGLHYYLADKFRRVSLSREEFELLRGAYPVKVKRILAIDGFKFKKHYEDLFLTLPSDWGYKCYQRYRLFMDTHIQGIRHGWKMTFYRTVVRPFLAARLRFKKIRNVAFVVAELGVWKTETLYQAMLADKKFKPMLAIVECQHCNVQEVINYVEQRGYPYVIVPEDKTICEVLKPDIIFYQRPYYGVISEKHEFYNNTRALFCYAGYGMRSCTNSWITHSALVGNCWQIYYENESNRRLYSSLNKQCRFNGRATGLPVMDEMNLKPEKLPDPWKPSNGKKRIIYAPHFSIDSAGWTHSSTFLTLGEKMLEIARRYSDRVQWAFKPHPLLRSRLNEIWGKERTDEYYRQWDEAEWSQYENGRYAGLFAHSDAIIHDCFSFTLEYLATGNPAMYLKEPEAAVGENLNEMHRKAMALHVQGNTPEAIESFIESIVSGASTNDAERRDFIQEYLVPPAPGAVASILKALS